MNTLDCSGICIEGHYCPEGSISPIPCEDASSYCAQGASSPIKVRKGYYSTGGNAFDKKTNEAIAPKGFYAQEGLLFECPAGTFGDIEGNSDASCSGPCDAGWYCPPGSRSATERFCGGSNLFCPEMSTAPSNVRLGYYTTVMDEECPPGQILTQVISQSNMLIAKCELCEEGKYKFEKGNDKMQCLDCIGNADSTANRITCHCRESLVGKNPKAFNVTTGKCEYVNDFLSNEKNHDNIKDSRLTKIEEFECEVGYWCNEGVRFPCPPGSYGNNVGETSPTCSGLCPAGYWCGLASHRPDNNKCGGHDKFCPAGSSSPSYVSIGYFTNEENHYLTRESQKICPSGYWCRNGLRKKCPPGRFGSSSGLFQPECDGLCSDGYYCPSGSTRSTQERCGNVTVHCPRGSSLPTITPPGYYSIRRKYEQEDDLEMQLDNSTMVSAKICKIGYWCKHGKIFQCPGGTYGYSIGLSSANACKPCRPGYYCPSYPGPPSTHSMQYFCGEQKYCPERSSKPIYIRIGHYGIGGVNKTVMIDQQICPPGNYCDNGSKFPCPQGTYGNTPGLFIKRCSGFCPAGYFCESGTIKPKRCAVNTYATPGSSSCASCGPSFEEIDHQRCRSSRLCCSQ